jgi:homoprotocatechuate degradation regulator HpaR
VLDKFDKSLPMMLYRTLDVLIPKYRAVFKQHDISETQWRILRVLWEHESCGAAELAESALLPASSLVGVIDRLIAKSLVQRTPSENDRRKVEVRLTKKGRALLPKITPEIDALYKDLQSSCDHKSWQAMINTMQQIIEAA